MKTGYLGPEGSYSELAHDNVFGKSANKTRLNNLYEVFKATSSGAIEAAVVPLENSIQGSVTECLDLLFDFKDVYVTAQTFIDINHRLIVKKGAKLADIKTVYSHEQAIKQCSEFLSLNLSGARFVYTDSTAASVRMIKSASDAGIVGKHITADGLELLDYEIADRANNQTRFGVIKKGRNKVPETSSKIFIAAGSKNKPGALLELLSVLKSARFNMTKIESRPLKTGIGEYFFFIEFDGNICAPEVKAVLEKLQNSATIFKLLGVY